MKTKTIVNFGCVILLALVPTSVFAACPDTKDPQCPEYINPNGISSLGNALCQDSSNPLCIINDIIFSGRGAEVLNVKINEENPDLPFSDYSYIDDEMCSIDDDPKCTSNSLITAYDGRNSQLEGYQRTGILFSPKGEDAARAYPESAFSVDMNKGNPDLEKRSMKSLGLGTSEEASRTTMKEYKPLNTLLNDSASDEFGVDQYLDRGTESKLGIANSTIAFLDKSIAASGAVTQDQVTANASNQMTKSINQVSAQMAHPELSPIYQDTDDKIEACMAAKGEIKAGKVSVKGFENIRFACSEKECGATPKEAELSGNKFTAGLYTYCVCCSESSNTVNKTTLDDIAQFKTEQWSLVDRVFFGNKVSDKDASADAKEKLKIVVLASTVFKNMYGDRTMTEKDGKIIYQYIYPSISPREKIDILRNGPKDSEGGNGADGGGSEFCIEETQNGDESCVGTGQRVKYGICPALLNILRKWPLAENASKADKDEISDWWREASLGRILNGSNINEFLELEGIIDENKSTTWRPTGRMNRVVESFCDASAVSAFEKFHRHMQTIGEMHMQNNNVASEQDKMEFRKLSNAVSSYLGLAKQTNTADDEAEAILAAIGAESDTKSLATNAAAVAGAQAGQRMEAGRGTSSFGGTGQLGGNP